MNARHTAAWLALALAVLIQASTPLAAQQIVPKGELVDDLPASVDPTAHYTLFLPRDYDAARSWPVLLIFDPRGRARQAAEIFLPAAERFGWVILSSNDSRSDGPWAPNQKAMAALWTELQRFSVDRSRVYAAGFSGGAIVSWVLAQSTREIAGIIAVGGRLPNEIPTDDIRFVHFGAFGSWDFNYDEMKAIDKLLAKRRVPHRSEAFDGPHSWFDASLAEEAVGWMELQAMRRELRPRDAALIEELWLADVSRAQSLLAAGEGLAAQRRFAQTTSIEVAVRVNDSFPGTWYNLACAAARTGAEKRAIEALQQAIDRGFSSLDQLDADADLGSLRQLEAYGELRKRLVSADSNPPPSNPTAGDEASDSAG